MSDIYIIEELNPETIYEEIRALYVSFVPEFAEIQTLESTPEAKFLQAMAMREFHIRARINEVYRSFLVRYGRGDALDYLGEFYEAVRLEGEDDDRFKRRIKLAIAGRSTGGTKARYKSIVLSSSLDVRDVEIWREGRDPTLNVAVLSTQGSGDASPALLATVRQALTLPEHELLNERFNIVSAVRRSAQLGVWAQVPITAPASIEDDIKAALADAWIKTDLLGQSLTAGWVVQTMMGLESVFDAALKTPETGVVAGHNEALEITGITVELERV